ncbi:DUF1638 domain-containing protein [Candidatus Bathyarchaeota archaeon]|nr:DUF1638 domain-containing protein [Candidatus Bathyarchaeota archaeon]
MSKKEKICLVSCSVLKQELQELVRQGNLNAELVFVSKLFHVDYALVEKNVRKVLEKTLTRYPGKVILVYGDLCLGQDNEMKTLAEEYGVVKVDALNCIDCQMGGKGKFLAADPEHNLMFMGPGMIEFFKDMKEKMRKEGVDEAAFANMFSGMKGIVVLDTCGDAEVIKAEIEKSKIGLKILETRAIGLDGVKSVINEAIERHNQASA